MIEEELEETMGNLEDFILNHRDPSAAEIAEYCILFKDYVGKYEQACEAGVDADSIVINVRSKKSKEDKTFIEEYFLKYLSTAINFALQNE